MEEKKDIWFPALTYGYGWGIPVKWQGWVVMAAYIILITAGTFFIDSPKKLLLFYAYSLILTLALIFICWLKGEKPRWRWGDEE